MDLIALIWDWDILFHHSFWALLYRSPLLVSTLPFSFLKVNYLNNLHLLNLFFSSNTPLFSATTHSLFHSNNTFLFLFITLPHLFHSLHPLSISYSSLPLVLLYILLQCQVFLSSKLQCGMFVLPTIFLHVFGVTNFLCCLMFEHHFYV